jgi:hypothetical protein
MKSEPNRIKISENLRKIKAERERFNSFPADLSNYDLIAFFTLSEDTWRQVPQTTTDPNRPDFARRILRRRFLGEIDWKLVSAGGY